LACTEYIYSYNQSQNQAGAGQDDDVRFSLGAGVPSKAAVGRVKPIEARVKLTFSRARKSFALP
jgi:hypothetical protein